MGSKDHGYLIVILSCLIKHFSPIIESNVLHCFLLLQQSYAVLECLCYEYLCLGQVPSVRSCRGKLSSVTFDIRAYPSVAYMWLGVYLAEV